MLRFCNGCDDGDGDENAMRGSSARGNCCNTSLVHVGAVCYNEDNNNIDSVDDDDKYDGCNAVPGSGARSNCWSTSLVHVGAASSVHKLFGWSVHKKALSCIMMWSRLVKLL